MKKMYGKPVTLRLLSVLMVSVLFGSAAARADVVLDWNAIAVNTAVANHANPFAQARYAAIVQLAVFEAVNAVTGQYQPYLGTITAPPGASADAAAIQAAYHVLNFYFGPSATLDAQYANSIGQIPNGPAKIDGIATGDAAAAALIALRANDGSSPPQTKIPGPAVPGEWQATPSCPMNGNGIQVGIAFRWQFVTPFGIPRASDFLLGPPPALTSNETMNTNGAMRSYAGRQPGCTRSAA